MTSSQTFSHKPKFGYFALTADILHVGHIRAMQYCKDRCEKLLVGIMTDKCVKQYKGMLPLINEFDRAEIVSSIKYVDMTVFQDTFEYPHPIITMKSFWVDEFIIFDSPEHRREYHDILVPATEGISSTQIKLKAHEYFNNR